MANKRVVTIVINASGKEVRETTKDVERLSDGLHELDLAQAREARQVLQQIDCTTLNQIRSQITQLKGSLQSFGGSLSSFGLKLTAALTVPIVGVTYALGKYGLTIDALKNQLTAFEGSAGKAETRLQSLRNLVDKSAGATREMAYGVYSLLKPLNGVSDITIDKTITSLGRLKLAFKDMIPTDFAYNMSQIFGQNFEEQDIKQAIGQVPKFREYLVKAFGTGDNETLAEMKKSGKITMDSFFQGIANAVQNDAVLQGLQEPVALRMQKFFERAFESVEPLANKIVDILAFVLETASPYLQQFGQWFKTLSPYAQNLIIVISGIAAALGPVLIVLGSLISFLAPIVTGIISLGVSIGAAGGSFAFFSATIGTVATFIASGLIPALTAIAPLVLAVIAVFAAVAAAAVALYAIWTTNFGGLKDTALEVWTVIKSVVQTGMSYVYSIVQSVGGQVVGWWRANYPLIKQIVETVSTSIKNTIGAFLNAVSGFWKEHGASISAYVATFWGYVKSIVSQTIDLIGKLIRFGLQVINGDFTGSWQTLLQIIQNGAKLGVTVWRGFLDTLGKLLAAIIPIAVEYGTKFVTTIAAWFGKAVVGAVYIIATLPQRIVELVPKLVRAGMSIASAVWKGIKDGLSGAAETLPTAVELSAQNTYGQKPIDYSRPQDLPKQNEVKQAALLDIGKLSQDASKMQKDREAMAKAELSAQINLYQNQISEVEKIYKDSFDKISETFKETNNPQQFQASFDQLKQWYGEQINTLAPVWEELVKKQTLAEKKGKLEQYEVYQQTQKRLQELGNLTFELADKANKLIAENRIKVDKDVIQSAEQRVQRLTALASSETQTKIQLIQYLAKTGAISESQAAAESFDISQKLLEAKKHAYEELLKLAKGNTDKEIEFQQQIKLLDYEISQQKIDNAQKVFDAKKKYADLITGLKEDGTNESLRLQQEIELLGVTDEVEKERIKNAYELIALRQKLKTDGFGEQQIEEAIKIKKVTQDNNLDLVRGKAGKQSDIDTAKKAADEQKKIAEDAQKQIEAIAGRIEGSLNNIFNAFRGGVKKGFSAIWGEIKNLFSSVVGNYIQSLSKSLAQMFGKVFGGASGNGKGSSSGGGFDIGSIIKNLFGGGNRSSSGSTGSIITLPNGEPAFNVSGSSSGGAGGGMWGGWNQFASDRNGLQSSLGGGKLNLGSLFGKGGIFGSKGFGFNSGTIGAAGMGAGILGSLIGGTGGSVLSGAASGIGAASALSSILGVSSIGGPVGLAIGAAIGGGIALFSALFGKSKQRKADEKSRAQFMRDAVANMGELDRLIADVKALRVDPAGAIATGEGIGREIRDNYMQQASALKDKKTRNIALRDVGQIDSAIAAKMVVLRGAADVSSAAKDNRERIIPQFATGAYIDPAFLKQYGEFKRRNGMLQGAFTGQDILPSMLAKGEMVLNPTQINAVITAAGGVDLFKYAKIPGYASGTYVAPSPSAPMQSIVAPSPYSNPNNQSSERRKIEITIINNNKGIVESDMPQIIVKGLDDYDVTTKLFDKINDGQRRNKVG